MIGVIHYSQARRDAPLTIETGHIVELQNIRRHLEVLQEQTRDLQSSIRQTLSSLARGSFDALRSRMVGEMGAAGPSEPPSTVTPDQQAAFHVSALRERILDAVRTAAGTVGPPGAANSVPPTPIIAAEPPSTFSSVPAPVAAPPPPRPPAESSTTRALHVSSSPGNDAVIRITFSPRITSALNAPELGRVSPPGPYMFSNSPSPSRSRVPPVLTMHYDIGEGYYRTRITTNSNNGAGEPGPSNNSPSEPMPGTSRDTNPGRNDPYRRMFREYHMMGDRNMTESEHSRFCPFSGREGNMTRPPPRMRCLTEMGEHPVLTGKSPISMLKYKDSCSGTC
jgi:hypothetical protein